jgi:hypothetical protein
VVDGAAVVLGVVAGNVVGAGVGAAVDAGARVADESSLPPHDATTTRHPVSSASVFIAEF